MSHSPAVMRRRRRLDLIWVAGVALLLCALGWIVVTMRDLSSALHDANVARDALAQQVRDLGGTPVVGERGEPGKDATGQPGEQGQPGQSGSPGSPGASGSPGKDGTPGKDGADGNPGPSGSPGPAGVAGQDGANGQDGQNGQDGSDGKDGQTCPDGYTLQPDPEDPDNLVCRREGATPTPTPTATETASASPSPSDTSLLRSLLGRHQN